MSRSYELCGCASVDADAVREAKPLVGELRVIHAQLQAVDHATTGVDGQVMRATAARMRALSNAVDTIRRQRNHGYTRPARGAA